jgi:hypothetical protein
LVPFHAVVVALVIVLLLDLGVDVLAPLDVVSSVVKEEIDWGVYDQDQADIARAYSASLVRVGIGKGDVKELEHRQY